MCMHAHFFLLPSVWLLLRREYDYISFSSIVAGRALRKCNIECLQDDQWCEEVAFW
jgi:hypothetical protein